MANQHITDSMLWIVGPIAPDFRSYLRERQISYGLFADQAKAVPEHSQTAPVIRCDFSSQEALIASVGSQDPQPAVTAIMTSGYEQYVLPAAWLAEHFEVPGTSAESAIAATNKFIMRQKFQAHAPEVSPDFTLAHTWEHALAFATTHNFPLILKPTNLMKSLYVSKVNDMVELETHYRALADNLQPLQKRFHLKQPPEILVEEFLQGSMHTVAGFADAEGNFHAAPGITDCLTAQEIGVKDNYLYSRRLPSDLDQSQAAAIHGVAEKGVKALGLTSSPLHIELMLTATGPKIIEIGARLGGYRARMYQAGFGVDLHRAAITTAYGESPVLSPTHTSFQAVIELFPDHPGTFSSVINADELKAQPACQNLVLKFETGKQVGQANQGFLAPAIVFVGHEDRQPFEACLDYLRQHVRIAID